MEWEMVTSSPYNGVINVKKEKRHNIRILNMSQIKYLLRKSKSNSIILYQFIMLALSTGLKRAEIFALKKEDIDLKNKKITVNKTLYTGKIIMSRAKTTIRQVDIQDSIISQLEKSLGNKEENDFIFYDTKLSYYTQDKRLRAIFSSMVKQLNLEKFAFDELRHTYAYNCLQQGRSIDYLHKQLGDYSIQATMDKYRDFIN
jgi:integrase